MSPEIDLTTHIQDIVGLIRCEELSDVVLCGHSYGGMVISGVAEQIAERLRALVYLDAFVPENGKSLLDYLPAEQAEGMRTDAARNGEGFKVTPIPAAHFQVHSKNTAWVDDMCMKHPPATFEQRAALSGRHLLPKRVYILATGWEVPTSQQFAARFKDDQGWQIINIACGHEVMIDRPQELAAALIAAA
jgi:pimeloyl-ACP methyl ester carboxylesterase